MTRTINVHHLARVEGHGGITVVLDGDRISKLELDIFEGIRLFEGLVAGRQLEEIPGIVSRICAICSHGHSITALQALERALGVEVSPQTWLLRDLAFQGQDIESHALHVFVLVLPDLVQHPSAISLARTNPEAVKLALRLKKLGNTVQEVLGGRAVHPVNYVIGGFGKLPTVDDLVRLRRDLEAGLEDCARAIDVLATIPVPEFLREPIECAALVPRGDMLFFGDTIATTTGARIPVAEYRTLTNEHTVPHSHAKHSAHGGKAFMVGSLARLSLHGDRFGGRARDTWRRLGLKVPSTNIVANCVAQAVELVFSVERALALVDRLLRDGLRAEQPVPWTARACEGAAATEVPRGTLYHWYRIDGDGRIVAADVITPTAQNLSHAEVQLRAAVRDGVGASDEVLRHRLEQVVRAYDPCISCSVHVLRAGG